MTNARHNPMNPRHSIYADGYAVGFYDMLKQVYHFHFYDEQYTVPCADIYTEIHAPWGPLARIEHVRAAAIKH